jgi:hypothetical protein
MVEGREIQPTTLKGASFVCDKFKFLIETVNA